MKFFSLNWIYKNWREVFGLSFMGIIFTGLCISLATTDPELKYEDSRRQLKIQFENEMKEINLPKTVVDKFEESEKSSSVLVRTRYRTALHQHEFLSHIKRELKKKDWIFYQEEGQNTYKFCRGKYDATLYVEEKKIYEKVGYYDLSFSTGNSSRPFFDFGNLVPESCR